jgi:hypothetical protein
MAAVITVKGYFGEDDGDSREGKVTVRYLFRGTNGVLSIAFPGRYGVDLPSQRIERMVAQTRREARRHEPLKTIECEGTIDGYYTAQRGGSRPVKISTWLRSRGGFESLTVEIGHMGQISVPWGDIERMILQERKYYV